MESKEPLRPGEFPEQKKLRGLYKHVRISVRTLDIIIVCGILAILLCVFIATRSSGYTVTFDSAGGSDVASQVLTHGDLVEEPAPPTREGYTFDGWYSDDALNNRWDFEHTQVDGSLELYAKWIPASE